MAPSIKTLRAILRDGPDSDQVAILNRSHVVHIQTNKRLSFAGSGHKLNLRAIGLVHLHDGPQVSVAKTLLRQISVKHHGIEKLYIMVISPGNAD
jgi:hypothetical protein